MTRVLIAKSDFGGHTRGSKITDPNQIAEILAGENAAHVIASDHPDEAVQSAVHDEPEPDADHAEHEAE